MPKMPRAMKTPATTTQGGHAAVAMPPAHSLPGLRPQRPGRLIDAFDVRHSHGSTSVSSKIRRVIRAHCQPRRRVPMPHPPGR